MSDLPKCTSWRGHKFEARFSSEPSAALAGFRAEVMPADMPLLLTKRTYERDICVRCGVTVERESRPETAETQAASTS